MEPERKIEKWLKAYAKKRRTQAGEPFKLHPATRRLLQSEVARDKPKPDDEDESVPLWEVIRQQWAILLSFAVCIFLVGIILLPVVSSSNKRAALASTTNVRERGTAAPALGSDNKVATALDEIKSTNLADISLAANQNTGMGSSVDQDKALANRDAEQATNGVKTPAIAMTVTPTAAPAVSHSIAATPLEVSPGPSAMPPEPAGGNYAVNETEGALPVVTSQPGAAQAPSPPPSTMVAAAAPGGNFQSAQPAEQSLETAPAAEMPALGQNMSTFSEKPKSEFSSWGVASRNLFKNSITPVPANPVLANFQVQQNGSAIRLVDQDGSVYDGSLLLANKKVDKDVDQTTAALDRRAMENAVTVATGLPGQQIAAAQDALQVAQTYFFHVYGINRTIKQTVSFTGSLTANFTSTNGAKLAFEITDDSAGIRSGGFGGGGGGGGGVAVGGAFSRAKSETTNQLAQLPWANLRITGTAVVDRTNRVPINAAPVAPNKN